MTTINRYKEIFNMSRSGLNVPDYTISDRETDVYITFLNTDRLDLISNRIYDRPDFWWIILAANGYSSEFDIEDGEILRVPYPIRSVLDEIGKQVK